MEQVSERGGYPCRGDVVEIVALKADGHPYRWWNAEIESIGHRRVVTLSHIGEPVYGPGGGWSHCHNIRTVYWLDRPYNLLEVYEPNGRLKQIYIHIASPPQLEDGRLVYTDHELDVVSRRGQPPRVVDEDEFAAACHTFGYTCEFQASCRKAVAEALRLCRRWTPMGPPRCV